MLCGVCRTPAGVTPRQQKEHATIFHGYPNCTTCGLVFKNLKLFEKHVVTPHVTKKCQLETCDAQVLCGKELDHATEAHGFPTCPTCSHKVNANFGVYYRHLASHQQDSEEKCACCDEFVPGRKGREHAIVAHGYPHCPVCSIKINSNYVHFMSHLKLHEVESPCGMCDEPVRQKNQTAHATGCHGFPVCATCSKTFDSVPMFCSHVRKCASSEQARCACPLCGLVIQSDKATVVGHLVEKHEFSGFECTKCHVGRDSPTMTCLAFLKHLSRCFLGTNYECAKCDGRFETAYRLRTHHCLPPGGTLMSADSYMRAMNGRMYVLHFNGMRLKVETEMTGYVNGLQKLIPAPGVTPVTSFVETTEEATHRVNRHGRPKMMEDSRIFHEYAQELPLFYRFLGVPWELGGSSMPDMKLALLHVFKNRPPCDFWLYLVHRLRRFVVDEEEIREMEQMLRFVTLPPGVDEKYRDFAHIRFLVEDVEKCAKAMKHQVEYLCDNELLTPRSIEVELKTIERASRKRLKVATETLPLNLVLDKVVYNSVDNEERVLKRQRFERGEITYQGNNSVVSVEVQVLKNKSLVETVARSNRGSVACLRLIETENRRFHVPDGDPCHVFDVDRFLREKENGRASPPVVLETSSSEAVPAFVNFDDVIYRVFRDFVLHFSRKSLRLCLNFFNQEPTWRDLSELIKAFHPFFLTDKNTPGSGCDRAFALDQDLQNEYLFLRNLYYRSTRVSSMRCSDMITLDAQTERVRALRIHRRS